MCCLDVCFIMKWLIFIYELHGLRSKDPCKSNLKWPYHIAGQCLDYLHMLVRLFAVDKKLAKAPMIVFRSSSKYKIAVLV